MIDSFLVSYSLALAVIGIILFLVGYIIPFLGQYKIVAQFVGILILVIGIFYQGKESERAGWETKMAMADLEIARLESLSKDINTQVITVYLDKIRYVDKVETQTVKEFVTVESDKKCEVNNGFVRLHDAIVEQKIIAPASSDQEKSIYSLSDISYTLKTNYSACQKNAEQLIALQNWIKDQTILWNKK